MRKSVMCTCTLTLLLFTAPGLLAEKIAVFAELSRPEMIAACGDELFVVEDASVYVYSLQDLKLVRRFGKRGNGPGELNPAMRYPLHLQVQGSQVLVNSWSKMVVFTRGGDFVTEKRFPFIAMQVVPIGSNFAVVKSVLDERGENSVGVVVCDAELNERKIIYSRSYPHYQKSGRLDIIPEFVLIRADEGRLFVFDQKQFADFVIHVTDASGKPLKKIKAKNKRQKVTRAYIDKTWEWAEQDIRFRSLSEEMKRMVTFPDYFPVMKSFQVADGKIYVHTYQTRDDESEFIILDLEGKILQRVYLPGANKNTIEAAPYTFKNNKYIYLMEDIDNEEWQLHIENLF